MGKQDMDVSQIQRWSSMMDRCYNPHHVGYHRYGGRGIRVCERWHVYQNWFDDLAPFPDGMSMDRIDNDGNYEPGNVRWADATTQANNRSTNINVTLRGKTQTLAQWSDETGLVARTIALRLRKGMTPEEAFDTPIRTQEPELVYEYQGRTQTLQQWADEFGLVKRTLDNRLREGWDIKTALETPVQKRDLDVDGEVKSVSQAARETGISRTGLQYRLARGMAPEEALSKPVMQEKVWTYKGKSQSVYAWANELGLPYSGLMARYNRGWTAEKALTTPVKEMTKHDPEVLQQAKDNGVSEELFRKRLKKGWSLEDALKPVVANKVWEYNGKTQSIHAWSKDTGIPYVALLGRYDRGWTAEKALTTPVGPNGKKK